MKHTRTIALSIVGLISALLLVTLAIAQTAQANPNSRSEKLLGSWNVVVTTEVQGITFPALLTFSDDGGMIADEPPSPFETSGHGNWVSAGRRDVAYTFVSLIGSAEGPLSSKLKVVGTLQYDAGSDNWSGPFKIDVFDANGQVIFTDHGTFSLARIAVEPLN
jgi:hypothetical protein